MNIRFCYDCMDSILKVEDLNIYVIIKKKNSNKAQRFSSEFVYLFHCVIYTRVQCSYVSRTDFLDKQILIVVTVELEANMAAFHSVPVELVFSC